MAGTVLTEISKDEHERAKFMSRRKYEMEQTSNLLTAEERGRNEGKAIGKEEGIEEGITIGKAEGITIGKEEGVTAVASRMLKRNKPIDEIIEDTGLTREEVEVLRELASAQ